MLMDIKRSAEIDRWAGDAMVRQIDREAEYRVKEERQACALIAEVEGCGKAGCGECVGGRIAAKIRARVGWRNVEPTS